MEALSIENAYNQLHERCGLVDCSARESILVTGPDRKSFIHGMVTCDVNRLAPGQWSDAALCTAKGAMISDARVLNHAEFVTLTVEPGYGEKARAHLEKYLISEEAELAAQDDRAVLLIVGPQAQAAVAALEGPLPEGDGFTTLAGDIWCLKYSRLGVPAFELYVPKPKLEETSRSLRALGAVSCLPEALEILRVEAGVGRMGFDMNESTIPLEANLDHAISYEKGCYIGQEVIARATFRGHVNKKLVRLGFAGPLPEAGAVLKKADKVVGRVTSTAQSPAQGPIGLGYVHRSLITKGTELALDGGQSVTVSG